MCPKRPRTQNELGGCTGWSMVHGENGTERLPASHPSLPPTFRLKALGHKRPTVNQDNKLMAVPAERLHSFPPRPVAFHHDVTLTRHWWAQPSPTRTESNLKTFIFAIHVLLHHENKTKEKKKRRKVN